MALAIQETQEFVSRKRRSELLDLPKNALVDMVMSLESQVRKREGVVKRLQQYDRRRAVSDQKNTFKLLMMMQTLDFKFSVFQNKQGPG